MHSFEEDNELDQVAKKAAEAFDAPGMANWDKMQLLLDQEMPLAKPKKRFIWVILPTLLLLGIGVCWWYSKADQTITVKENISKPVPVEIPTNINQASSIEANKTTQPAITSNEKNSKVNSNGLNARKTGESSSSLLSQMGIDKGPIDQVIIKENANKLINNNSINETEVAKNQSFEQVPQPAAMTASNEAANNAKVATNHVNTIKTEDQAPNIIIQNKKSSEKGFFIGITAGIDASTVHFSYKEDLGYNIGGIIGYRFNQHFSIKTGGIYTQKNYKMNGVDFHAPKGTWVSYFKMETVTGTCDMWDVPLIGTYHFKYNGKGNYFASLGTSSYFMKKENYSYLYYVNNQTYNRSASYLSTDQHLFALVHISGGIEKPMGKHLTGIIEPYAKIPLGGVGFGSIELSSFGVNFSLTYKQPKRK